ncbi:hypothetical protein ANA_C10134 [Anabaena sp. 90]|nr:hypothetical protein ANA_C10134 [Anabaena sp. 90]
MLPMPIYFLFVYALLKNYLNPEEPVNSIVLKFAVFLLMAYTILAYSYSWLILIVHQN